MKQQLFEFFSTSGDLTLENVILNVLMSALFGFLIYISYALSHKGTIYSKKFNVSLLMLTILTGTVMTVIGNNVALSLGMVGALSIVRFRTAVKDSRDTVYIFWTIIAGICCGVGDYEVAAIGSVVTFIAMLILGRIRNDNRLLIVVRASLEKQEAIQSFMFRYFDGHAVMRAKNTTPDSVEFIFEASTQLLEKTENKNGNIIENLYRIGDIAYANIVVQNDDISN